MAALTAVSSAGWTAVRWDALMAPPKAVLSVEWTVAQMAGHWVGLSAAHWAALSAD